MNSLNIVSRLTSTPPATPPRTRTSSAAQIHTLSSKSQQPSSDGTSLDPSDLSEKLKGVKTEETEAGDGAHEYDEKTPLLDGTGYSGAHAQQQPRSWSLSRRIASAVIHGVKVVFTTITAPGRYVIACFYDDQGHFSAVLPLRNFKNLVFRRKRRSAQKVEAHPDSVASGRDAKASGSTKHKRSPSLESNASSTSAGSSDGESPAEDSPAKHTRSRTHSLQRGEDGTTAKKTGRVKLLHNEEAVRKRKSTRAKKAGTNPDDVATIATSLKSPLSPSSSKLTRYPRAPAPPRPLVPRRQLSYIGKNLLSDLPPPQKTLIIDLDETLIHSMAKGGRMSTGHMVEVRLGGPVSTSGVSLGPGVPILYYVHERPGCHEFLRKVEKWFNLVVFTASVQEYADPVIDWLEREKKYFKGRYYRQHCTFRNGAYIKDLAQVEPDLSKVMILDNSPMSYIFHEGKHHSALRKEGKLTFADNAIPIEGWISDPTDSDLLHLIPLLEGLQHVTDVRALLALRQGQAQQA